jgi:SAM-dependent methyltransferase
MTTDFWIFDNEIANRFQAEAETNIPSYHTVISKCLQFANKNLEKSDKIIDVGSALGYTISKFKNAGFTNVIGVDNSPAMIEKSVFKDIVICSNFLPKDIYKLIIINWTLHFIANKIQYLRDVYNNLDNNGYLILSDKCCQTDLVKDMYYDFKRNNGVSEEYIIEKEKKLIGVMQSVSIGWYLNTLQEIGFIVDVIHGDLGFVTFLCCKKSN